MYSQFEILKTKYRYELYTEICFFELCLPIAHSFIRAMQQWLSRLTSLAK